jgi:hypothetical protein
MRLYTVLLAGFVASVSAGCDIFTAPNALAEFAYNENNHGTAIEDIVEVVELGNEFYLQGELNTPTPCYELEAENVKSGNRLTLTITGKRRNITCAQTILGGYRYQAVFRSLDAGTYNLKVIHSFPPAERATKEFNLVVNVR